MAKARDYKKLLEILKHIKLKTSVGNKKDMEKYYNFVMSLSKFKYKDDIDELKEELDEYIEENYLWEFDKFAPLSANEVYEEMLFAIDETKGDIAYYKKLVETLQEQLLFETLKGQDFYKLSKELKDAGFILAGLDEDEVVDDISNIVSNILIPYENKVRLFDEDYNEIIEGKIKKGNWHYDKDSGELVFEYNLEEAIDSYTKKVITKDTIEEIKDKAEEQAKVIFKEKAAKDELNKKYFTKRKVVTIDRVKTNLTKWEYDLYEAVRSTNAYAANQGFLTDDEWKLNIIEQRLRAKYPDGPPDYVMEKHNGKSIYDKYKDMFKVKEERLTFINETVYKCDITNLDKVQKKMFGETLPDLPETVNKYDLEPPKYARYNGMSWDTYEEGERLHYYTEVKYIKETGEVVINKPVVTEEPIVIKEYNRKAKNDYGKYKDIKTKKALLITNKEGVQKVFNDPIYIKPPRINAADEHIFKEILEEAKDLKVETKKGIKNLTETKIREILNMRATDDRIKVTKDTVEINGKKFKNPVVFEAPTIKNDAKTKEMLKDIADYTGVSVEEVKQKLLNPSKHSDFKFKEVDKSEYKGRESKYMQEKRAKQEKKPRYEKKHKYDTEDYIVDGKKVGTLHYKDGVEYKIVYDDGTTKRLTKGNKTRDAENERAKLFKNNKNREYVPPKPKLSDFKKKIQYNPVLDAYGNEVGKMKIVVEQRPKANVWVDGTYEIVVTPSEYINKKLSPENFKKLEEKVKKDGKSVEKLKEMIDSNHLIFNWDSWSDRYQKKTVTFINKQGRTAELPKGFEYVNGKLTDTAGRRKKIMEETVLDEDRLKFVQQYRYYGNIIPAKNTRPTTIRQTAKEIFNDPNKSIKVKGKVYDLNIIEAKDKNKVINFIKAKGYNKEEAKLFINEYAALLSNDEVYAKLPNLIPTKFRNNSGASLTNDVERALISQGFTDVEFDKYTRRVGYNTPLNRFRDNLFKKIDKDDTIPGVNPKKLKKDYWKKRVEQLDKYTEANAAALNNRLQRHYAEYYKKLLKDYRELIDPYVIDEDTIDIDRYKKDLAKDPKLKAKAAQMENNAAQFSGFMTKEQKAGLDETLSKTYETGYMQMVEGFETNKELVRSLNKAKIDQVIMSPFFGENYVQRATRNGGRFTTQLKQVLTESITNGYGYKKASKLLGKRIQATSYECYRLVFTEMRWISTMAKKNAWTDGGVKMVEIIHNTPHCKICQDLAGKKFPLKDAEPGKELPPYHPNCYATYAPVIPDWLLSDSEELGKKTEHTEKQHQGEYINEDNDYEYDWNDDDDSWNDDYDMEDEWWD